MVQRSQPSTRDLEKDLLQENGVGAADYVAAFLDDDDVVMEPGVGLDEVGELADCFGFQVVGEGAGADAAPIGPNTSQSCLTVQTT